MKINMGTADRTIRAVLAVVIVVLLLTGSPSGTPAVILGIVAIALLLTSAIGFCPVYYPFGISTKKKEQTSR